MRENVEEKLVIKDWIALIVANTFHTEITFDYICSGDHLYRLEMKNLTKEQIRYIIEEMVTERHLISTNGEFLLGRLGQKVFAEGGYVTQSVRYSSQFRDRPITVLNKDFEVYKLIISVLFYGICSYVVMVEDGSTWLIFVPLISNFNLSFGTGNKRPALVFGVTPFFVGVGTLLLCALISGRLIHAFWL